MYLPTLKCIKRKIKFNREMNIKFYRNLDDIYKLYFLSFEVYDVKDEVIPLPVYIKGL